MRNYTHALVVRDYVPTDADIALESRLNELLALMPDHLVNAELEGTGIEKVFYGEDRGIVDRRALPLTYSNPRFGLSAISAVTVDGELLLCRLVAGTVRYISDLELPRVDWYHASLFPKQYTLCVACRSIEVLERELDL